MIEKGINKLPLPAFGLVPATGPERTINNASSYLAEDDRTNSSTNQLALQKTRTFPASLKVNQPKPTPVTPSKAFTPPNPQTTGINTPEIAEWTRTAGPDESVVLTGVNFTPDTRFVVYASDQIKDAVIQRILSDRAIITLPKDLPKWQMYLVWPVNKAGYGLPVAINKTEAWWLGPDNASPGQTLSVYGCNLAQNNGRGNLAAYVYLTSANGKGYWANVKEVNPYKVDFIVPAVLPVGEYEVWAYNGLGSNFGWAAPLSLIITPAVKFSGKEFNIKDFGALPTATSERNTTAIRKAIEAAKNAAGGTVVFPAGVYFVNDYLPATANTRWRGAGKDKTYLKCAPTFSKSAQGLISGAVKNFGVSSLTFDTNKNFRGAIDKPVFLRHSTQVRFTNVGFSFQGYDLLDLHDCRYIFFNQCEFIGKASFLGKGSQLFFDGNSFKLTNDTDMALHSWGGVGISLTRNTCQDLDNRDLDSGAGWGKGRFFTGNGIWGSCRNTYLGQNTTTDLTVRPAHNPIRHGEDPDQNSGEQFMWEGGEGKWAGYVKAANEDTLTISGYDQKTPDIQYAVITKGKGFGQSRRIIRNNNGTLTLHQPWRVIPDTSSHVVIGDFHDRIVVYQNFLDGKTRAVTSEEHTATAGIEPFGGVLNFIAAENTLQSLRAGIANFAIQHNTGHDPNFFHLYLNNKFINCRWAIKNWAFPNHGKQVATQGPFMFGVIYRNNAAQGSVLTDVVNEVPKTGAPLLNMIIYEHNQFKEDKQELAGLGEQLFYKNKN
ncbi:MAG: glycosyl hydrolase family 28-related protein [Adhaeribacter sp.]